MKLVKLWTHAFNNNTDLAITVSILISMLSAIISVLLIGLIFMASFLAAPEEGGILLPNFIINLLDWATESGGFFAGLLALAIWILYYATLSFLILHLAVFFVLETTRGLRSIFRLVKA